MDEPENLVIELGSHTVKAGFAGDDAPRAVFPSYIGTSRFPFLMTGAHHRSFYVGDEATNKCGILRRQPVIKNRKVEDWDRMEMLLEHTFTNELRVDCKNHAVLFDDAPLTGPQFKQGMCMLLFEKFELPATYFQLGSILAHYASGRCSGLDIHIGHDFSYSMPIYEGYTITRSFQQSCVAGNTINELLQHMLIARDVPSLNCPSGYYVADQVKIKHAYVASDFRSEIMDTLMRSREAIDYRLPDGSTFSVDSERFRCTEVLFNPNLFGIDAPGIHEITYNTLQKMDIDTRKDMWGNLLLSGGTTLLPGFSDRLELEMKKLAPPTMRIKIIAPPERKYSVWIGGSILASLSTFQQLWITKDEYDEDGPNIALQKCFSGHTERPWWIKNAIEQGKRSLNRHR
mmetsp:Transcript_6559/g.11423  ORF Transcript_6559/g.11423 Transcript_6559/m.11423 type:complete len:401 (-) Transcript_6559:38-1240(-)